MERYVKMISRLHAYCPELPHEVLSQAVGVQGNTRRLERVLTSMIQGGRKRVQLLHQLKLKLLSSSQSTLWSDLLCCSVAYNCQVLEGSFHQS